MERFIANGALVMTVATVSGLFDVISEQVGQLYSPPATAMKVIELTEQPRMDVRALKECIERDPALAAKILRVANSAAMGQRRQISDLNQALSLMGVKPLKLLVLGFSVPKELFAGIENDVLQQYWHRALLKAVAAREFCTLIQPRHKEEAFIAGLLQDLGVLVLVRRLGKVYVQTLQDAYQSRGSVLELENAALGFDHAMLTANLLKKWRLPQNLVDAVGAPYDPAQIATLSPIKQTLAYSLYLAEATADLLLGSRLHAMEEILKVGEKACRLQSYELSAVTKRIEEALPSLAEALALPELPGMDGQSILALAHQQLADLVEEAAPDLVHLDQKQDKSDQKHELSQTDCLSHDSTLTRLRAEGERWLEQETAPRSGEFPSKIDHHESGDAAEESVNSQTSDPESRLLMQIELSIQRCRQHRSPVSVLIARMDDCQPPAPQHGAEEGVEESAQGAAAVAKLFETALVKIQNKFQERITTQQQTGRSCFVMLMEDYDRSQAVQFARRLVEGFRRWTEELEQRGLPQSRISVGAATVSIPSNNFPPHDLLTAAEHCLYAARSAGGNTWKSIEIY